MFKRFLMGFMAICSFMMGADLEKYRLYVKDIDTEFHAVALTNGLVCNVIKKDWGLEKSLEIGEEVELYLRYQKESKEETGEFDLAALSNERKGCGVWVTEESKLNAFSYVSLSTVVVQPAGWFFPEVTRKIVELSDGSKWEVEEVLKMEFSKGDHVFFSFSKIEGKVYLTNLDKVVPVSKSRLVNNIMFVKPYEAVSN